MAFFNANVDALMRSDLHDAYEDMAFGGQYAAIIGLFRKVEKDGEKQIEGDLVVLNQKGEPAIRGSFRAACS